MRQAIKRGARDVVVAMCGEDVACALLAEAGPKPLAQQAPSEHDDGAVNDVSGHDQHQHQQAVVDIQQEHRDEESKEP